MKTFVQIALVQMLVLFVSGCDTGPKSARGFSLPDGDAKQRELTFVELKCYACHTVSGVTLSNEKGEKFPEEKREQTIELGGEVARIKTYGELVTSIINPSHKLAKGYPLETIANEDSQSKMKNYNDVMTVSQLIDLVAFLQSHYKLQPYTPTDYHMYP